MNRHPHDHTASTEKKIAALIEQLLLTERELQALTGGQLDSISVPEGGPILLREAQEKLRLHAAAQHQAAEMQMAILNALPAHIALLDHQGVILAVNEAWRRFATANILQSPDFFIGQNYLGVCESAHGDCAEEAQPVANGIRSVLRGDLKDFSLEYPCHSSTEQRWFRLMVTPLNELPGQGAVVMHVNVTERRSAEETLRENQARLEAEARRLHESQMVASVGSWETDLDTLEVTWTTETHRIFGTEPALFAPTHTGFLERVHPADREAVNTAFAESLGKPGPFAIDHRLVMPDGSVKFVEERWRTFNDDAGKPMRALGTCQDITERKQAEVTLAESQRQYRDLVETSHNVIWAVDVEGRFTFLNQAARAIYGRDPEEMIGHRFHEFVPEDQHQANDEILASMLRDGLDTIDYSNRIRRKDGSIAILNSNARVVRDMQGQMIGISGMSQDTTESLKTQAALAASEQRLRMALNAAHMGTYEWDIPGGRIVWSREHEELWGYAAGEFDGTYEAFAKRVHPDDVAAINAEISRCMSAHERFVWEFRVLWADGTPHWMAGLGEFSYNQAGQPVRMHGAVMEITERRIAVEKLRQREALLDMAGKIARMGGWSVEYPQVCITWSDEVCALHDLPLGTVPTMDQALGFYPPGSREIVTEAVSACVRDGTPFDVELELITATGRKIWTRSIGQAEHDSAGMIKRVQGAFQDITDRKEAERELARTNRALKLLSGCSEALIHADDEMTLLRDVCQLAVDTGGYRMAWVGYARDDEKRSITPMAHAGVENGYLGEVSLTWDEQSRSGQGPAGRVIRSGEPVVCEDMESDAFFVWLNAARERGYRAVTCLPLRDKQRTFGLLALYSAAVNVTPAEELELLQKMADDLAFGILTLRLRADQRRTHEAVLTMARGISASTGNEFLEKLATSMVEALGAHAGFIAQLSDDKSMANTLCIVVEGKLAPNFEYDLFGTPCEDLGGKNVWVVPKDVQRLYPQAQTLQDLGVSAYVGTELYGADGEPCGQMAVLFRQPLEQHEFISSTLKIFASRAAGELERLKTDGRLREQAVLLDMAQDAILVRDLNHKILYWNRSAERLYGWRAEEVIGRTARELIYQDTAPLDAALQALLEKGEWVGEIQQVTKDGKALTVEGHWSLVLDEQGNPKSVLAINTDVTERKKIEAQYLRAQRMESIGTLAGGIAHDLNNVLAPIMLSIELLKMHEKNPRRLSVLTTIEGSAKRGAEMVEQVLSFARGVEGQQLEVQVGHLLREIAKIANETFLKNIEVHCDVSAELWVIKGDPTQLHQVLLNLCVNARDAMPNGGRITLVASNLMLDEQYTGMNIEAKPGPHVCIQVEDNGTGMPPEVVERIFEPFFTTKELGKGTGLGLSTTIAIIKSHGGFVRVYSEVGMGTRFRVYLPAQTEPGAVGSEAAEPELPRGNGELVLIIDDEAAVREITRQTLEAFGYRVLLATDGVEATSIYATRQKEIDLVLTDMMMPLMDGPTTIQVLLRMNPQARIIAASGLNANGMVAKAASAGVKHFIPKPYTAETLLKTIRELLDENPL